MKMLALGLTAFLLASPHLPAPPPAAVDEAQAETPFEPWPETFADPAACIAHLTAFVKAGTGLDAAVGPYRIATGDVRAHRVEAKDWSHDIEERRCLGAALSTRRWTHSMGDVKPITMGDIEKMSFPK